MSQRGQEDVYQQLDEMLERLDQQALVALARRIADEERYRIYIGYDAPVSWLRSVIRAMRPGETERMPIATCELVPALTTAAGELEILMLLDFQIAIGHTERVLNSLRMLLERSHQRGDSEEQFAVLVQRVQRSLVRQSEQLVALAQVRVIPDDDTADVPQYYRR